MISSLNFSPFPRLTTSRLILRKLNAEDADFIYQLRSDPEIMKYIGRPILKTIKEADTFVQNLISMQFKNSIVFWMLTLKDAPSKSIGNICIWKFDLDHSKGEVGYMLGKDYRGKGYMQEALQEVTRYAFESLKLHRVEAMTNPLNEGSKAVLLSSGFTLEGHLRENYLFDDVFYDSLVFGKINK